MVNIKPIISARLAADDPLVILLGGEHIYRTYPAQNATLPLIVYAEIANEPYITAGEIEEVSKISLQFDIYDTASVSEIAIALDNALTAIGTREQAPDQDDDQPKQCKSVVYSFLVDRELNFY